MLSSRFNLKNSIDVYDRDQSSTFLEGTARLPANDTGKFAPPEVQVSKLGKRPTENGVQIKTTKGAGGSREEELNSNSSQNSSLDLDESQLKASLNNKVSGSKRQKISVDFDVQSVFDSNRLEEVLAKAIENQLHSKARMLQNKFKRDLTIQFQKMWAKGIENLEQKIQETVEDSDHSQLSAVSDVDSNNSNKSSLKFRNKPFQLPSRRPDKKVLSDAKASIPRTIFSEQKKESSVPSQMLFNSKPQISLDTRREETQLSAPVKKIDT